MITLGMIVGAAAVALGLATWTRLPSPLVAILAGIALQILAAPVDGPVVRDGLLMAATFLVFVVGAAIERYPLRRFRQGALLFAALTMGITGGAGLLLWLLLELPGWTALYWVIALAASSTLLVFGLLRRRARFFEPVGRVVTATSLTQDLIVILALSGLAAASHPPPGAALVVGGLAVLAVSAWALARYVAPYAMLRLGFDEEERLLFVLLVLFSGVAVARWTGNPLVTGAYFAGMAISRFPVGELARGYLKSFYDFFSTIFYVMLGLVVAVPTLATVVPELVFVAALLLVRPLVLLPVARRAGLTVRSSIEAVLLLGQAGEIAVIVAVVGIELGHVGESFLSTVAVVVGITTALAPALSSDRTIWWLTHHYPFRDVLPPVPEFRDHLILLGCGETGRTLLEAMGDRKDRVVVVDDDPAVIRALEEEEIWAVRGDGADPEALTAAGAGRAKAVVSTMRRHEDNALVLAALRGPEVLVRVFSDEEAERIRSLAGHPVVEAELAAEALVSWSGRCPSGDHSRPAEAGRSGRMAAPSSAGRRAAAG